LSLSCDIFAFFDESRVNLKFVAVTNQLLNVVKFFVEGIGTIEHGLLLLFDSFLFLIFLFHDPILLFCKPLGMSNEIHLAFVIILLMEIFISGLILGLVNTCDFVIQSVNL